MFGGLWLYFRTSIARRAGMLGFALLMCGIQAYVFFGPPPGSAQAAALTALAAYVLFAVVIGLLERRATFASAHGP